MVADSAVPILELGSIAKGPEKIEPLLDVFDALRNYTSSTSDLQFVHTA
jgi:hypothetical protein